MPNIFTILADFHSGTTKIIDGVKNSDTDKTNNLKHITTFIFK